MFTVHANKHVDQKTPRKSRDRIRVLLALITAVLIGGCASTVNRPVSPAIPPEAEYLALPEERIDIATGALIIAGKLNPQLDIAHHLRQIDILADHLRPHLAGAQTAAQTVAIVNQFLFASENVQYRDDKPFLDNVLDDAKGNCLAWTTLYLSVAERLDLPCHAVRIPGHVFVRYDHGPTGLNIETTAKGQIRSDRHYMKMLQRCADASVPGKPVMQTLTKREFLSMILVSRGLICKDMENYDQAVADFTLAIELNPGYPGIYNNRGSVYAKKGRYDKAIADFTRAIELDPIYAQAYDNRGLAYAFKNDTDRSNGDWRLGAQLKAQHRIASNCPFAR